MKHLQYFIFFIGIMFLFSGCICHKVFLPEKKYNPNGELFDFVDKPLEITCIKEGAELAIYLNFCFGIVDSFYIKKMECKVLSSSSNNYLDLIKIRVEGEFAKPHLFFNSFDEVPFSKRFTTYAENTNRPLNLWKNNYTFYYKKDFGSEYDLEIKAELVKNDNIISLNKKIHVKLFTECFCVLFMRP